MTMKNVKRYGAIALILMAIISSCKKDRNSSDMKQAVESFSAIDYRLPGKLTVQNGDRFEVQIKEKGRHPDKTRTKVIDGELIIYADNDLAGNDFDIVVTTPTFKKLKNEGSGTVSIQYNFNPDASLELEASGPGSIFTLNAINAAKISAKVYGVGDINLSGGIVGTTELDAFVKGSGSIHAFFLNTKNTNAVVSGSGNVECNVLAKLDAHVTGSGNVLYKGNPAIVNPVITGTGKVEVR